MSSAVRRPQYPNSLNNCYHHHEQSAVCPFSSIREDALNLAILRSWFDARARPLFHRVSRCRSVDPVRAGPVRRSLVPRDL